MQFKTFPTSKTPQKQNLIIPADPQLAEIQTYFNNNID
jgi:hypothetical protein